MSKAARSLLVFAIYFVGLGLRLLIAPNTLIPLSGLPETYDMWIRVGWGCSSCCLPSAMSRPRFSPGLRCDLRDGALGRL